MATHDLSLTHNLIDRRCFTNVYYREQMNAKRLSLRWLASPNETPSQEEVVICRPTQHARAQNHVGTCAALYSSHKTPVLSCIADSMPEEHLISA